jgi:hypothetical protein
MPAIGGRNTETALAAGPNSMLLHQPLDALLAYANAPPP